VGSSQDFQILQIVMRKTKNNRLDVFLIGKILKENGQEEAHLDACKILLNFFDESMDNIIKFVQSNREEIDAVIMILNSEGKTLLKRIDKQNIQGCKEQSFMKKEKTRGIYDNDLPEIVNLSSLYNSLR
jgi:hypothetical protein